LPTVPNPAILIYLPDFFIFLYLLPRISFIWFFSFLIFRFFPRLCMVSRGGGSHVEPKDPLRPLQMPVSPQSAGKKSVLLQQKALSGGEEEPLVKAEAGHR
jgi:hypothetical protein